MLFAPTDALQPEGVRSSKPVTHNKREAVTPVLILGFRNWWYITVPPSAPYQRMNISLRMVCSTRVHHNNLMLRESQGYIVAIHRSLKTTLTAPPYLPPPTSRLTSHGYTHPDILALEEIRKSYSPECWFESVSKMPFQNDIQRISTELALCTRNDGGSYNWDILAPRISVCLTRRLNFELLRFWRITCSSLGWLLSLSPSLPSFDSFEGSLVGIWYGKKDANACADSGLEKRQPWWLWCAHTFGNSINPNSMHRVLQTQSCEETGIG